MNTGLILALIAAVSFAVGIVLVRKTAGEAGESFSVTAMSIFVGVPFFAIAIFISGDWHKLPSIPWQALALLSSAGIIHFIVGRLLAYNSFRLIGANRGTPITQISPLYTVILSWLFLDEKLTLYIAFGALCMLAGAFLISQERGRPYGEDKKPMPHEMEGILMSLGAGLCWGITPVLIKPAVEKAGSTIAGNFISYAAAGVLMGLMFLSRTRRNHFERLSFKKNIAPMALAGLFTAGGQLLYFAALGRSPANLVSPLVSIEVLFIFFLSFFINRKIELFTPRVFIGMAATLTGTFLLFR
jgi:drug/metabolite transporter (DMT)-like permease